MDLLPALQRSKENLLNLALFNFVYFDATHLPGTASIFILQLPKDGTSGRFPSWNMPNRNFSEFVKNREWDKINYGAFLKWNNFRGRNELLTGKIRLGYIKEYALAYSIPNLGKRAAAWSLHRF